MEAVARQLILTRHRSVPQNERSMNKYSCGNDPQPGDVVVREKLSQLISRTDMGGNQKLDWLISFISELQQPQPDMAKLIEEKDEAIRELRAGLEDILTINPSPPNTEK